MKLNGEAIALVIFDRLYSRFKVFSSGHIRGSVGIFIVYDVTDRGRYAKVPSFIENIQQHSKQGAQLMIIGNKSDLDTQRVVSFEEGKALADEFQAAFMETSARTAANVQAAFISMVAMIKARIEATRAQFVTEAFK
jgi:Ras-related protein Rab-1A